MKQLTTFLFFIAFSCNLWAAACCGGGSSLPTLISGDYKAQFSLTGANNAITHDASANGNISKRYGDNKEVVETLTLSVAMMVSTYWQVGLTLPYKKNTHDVDSFVQSDSGLSDPKLQIGYEFLPEYGYSAWRPRGYLFLEQSFATSTSTYDAHKTLRTDSLGNGLANTALGMAFFKIRGNFDFLFMAELHQGHERSFQIENQNFTVKPKLGYSSLLGGGYSFGGGDFRFGANLLYSREGAKEISGTVNSDGLPAWFWEVNSSLSYVLDGYSFSVIYKDQSFLAAAQNTTLGRGLSLNFVKFVEL